MAPILTEYYGDQGLSTILEAAKKNRSTEKLASRLQSQQFREWLNEGHSPDYVFYKVLDIQTTDKLLESPLFNTWHMYMHYYNARMPSKQITVIEALSHQFFPESVWEMIQSAKSVPNTKHFANSLEASLRNKLLSEKMEPSQVAMALNMRSTADDVFLERYTAELRKLYG